MIFFPLNWQYKHNKVNTIILHYFNHRNLGLWCLFRYHLLLKIPPWQFFHLFQFSILIRKELHLFYNTLLWLAIFVCSKATAYLTSQCLNTRKGFYLLLCYGQYLCYKPDNNGGKDQSKSGGTCKGSLIFSVQTLNTFGERLTHWYY